MAGLLCLPLPLRTRSTTMFSFGQRLGMLFRLMGASLSFVSVSVILLLAVSRWIRRTVMPWGKSKRTRDVSDNSIFLNLMFADLILSIGDFPIGQWLADGAITEGSVCTAQAVIKQVGSNGVALSSSAIAVYTFCVLVLRWTIPRYTSKLVVVMIWIFTALIIVIPYIPYRKERIYGNAGFWCWVRPDFKVLQLVTQYAWLWLAVILMAILYTIMFLVLRGWFIVDNGIWYWYENYVPRNGAPVEETEEERESKAIANMLLLYPMVYLICIGPHSIARWLHFSGIHVQYQVTLVFSTLFALSGMFNTFLFFFTRPDLVVGHDDPPPPAPTVDIQIQSVQDKELASLSSRNFGSFPSRSSAASDYAPPEGPNTNILASPRRMESNLASYATHTPGERSCRNFRSLPALPPVEEQTYGNLPG